MTAEAGIDVSRVAAADVDRAAALFASYREFYGCAYDERLASAFLRDRLRQGQSVVLVAELDPGDPVGFTQLYPGFSSVAAAPTWVLNDLYVRPSARGRGVAEALMTHGERLALEAGAVTVQLETHGDNAVARRLYERRGYRVDATVHYAKQLR